MIPFEGSTVNGWSIYENKRCDDSGYNFSDLKAENVGTCRKLIKDYSRKKKQTTLAPLSSSETKKKT